MTDIQIHDEQISPEVTFRLATTEDISLIKSCLIDSWVDHSRHEPTLMNEERMRASNIEAYYGQALHDPECRILVAEAGGQFAGFVRAQRERIPDFFIEPDILYLDDICVVEQFRRQGVATKLIGEIERIAKEEMHIRRIQGRVYSWNEDMLKLLRSLGYDIPHVTVNKLLDE